jgi:hypothetical protein
MSPRALSALSCLLLFGCNGDKDDTSLPSGDSGAPDVIEAVCEDPVEVTCVDQLILDLSLHDDKVSDGAVDNATDGDDFITTIDATAGGYQNAANNPWVYVRFTEDGAERVDIDDETALESMDWDLSMRRFILRLNGGSSGPSCVGAVTFLEQSYSDLTEVPDGLTYQQDEFYTDDCTLINDSSGLPGNPQVALGAWWSYGGCVATTEYPHLIQVADGRILKMVVEAYYGSGQEDCNDSDQMGSDSANFTIRWQWM